MKGYPPKDKIKLLTEFHSFNKGIEKIMAEKFGEKFARNAARNIKKEFKSLLQDMPYIGGDENPLTVTLTSTT
ncbi:MAG: hypothetical protein KO217_01750, partial [Methanobacteriaceae archaeon]|nr:hypothetical protein [Methanobacteriaceae archaeon]